MSQTRRSYRKRILAVDDAATILLRITDALDKYYDVVTVNSGALSGSVTKYTYFPSWWA